jgi:two-component sensor histidine kinase
VWYGTATDIHDLKEREERINLLLKEVNHRSKNLLTVVLSVARQTSRAGTPAEFIERLTSRVQGLAASQDLLVKSEWRGVALEDLVRAQLAPYQDLVDTRIRLIGPPLKIDASAAQAIGMALHELITNAAVHGALSAAGTVDITWDIVGAGASTEFRLSWQERDGPAVERPARLGFGHKVLLRTTEHALGAKCELDFDDGGLVWRLSTPLDRVAERPAEREFRISAQGVGV